MEDVREYLHLYKGSLGRMLKPKKQEWTEWTTIDRVYAGYGSKHDGGVFIIAICDDCIKSNPDKILYESNYF